MHSSAGCNGQAEAQLRASEFPSLILTCARTQNDEACVKLIEFHFELRKQRTDMCKI